VEVGTNARNALSRAQGCPWNRFLIAGRRMIRPQSLPILCPKGFDIAPVSAQADNNEEENENNIDVDRGLMLAGCGSMENEVPKSSTSDLLLRRSQLMYRLSMTRTSWGNRPFESNAYDDVKNDLKEKEAIERELARRHVAF